MRIVVLDRDSLGKDTPLDGLFEFGEVIVYPSTTPSQILERIADAEVVVLNKVKIDRRIIEESPKLKLICIFATGYDIIDVVAAKENNIAVCNVPGYSTDSVTLFTIANVLSLITHLREYNDYVTSGAYSDSGKGNKLEPVYHEIKGKTWGIIGCGNIGKAVARVAESFGAKVIVNKRTYDERYSCTDLETLCKESDIITIHCPLNDQTRNMINEKTISLMKKDVIIVNEARGAVVNDEAIVNAVLNNRIGAFGSDVYTIEPFGEEHVFNKIMKLPNVLLTPHAAWGAYESRVRCINIICTNIKSFMNGEKQNRVDI